MSLTVCDPLAIEKTLANSHVRHLRGVPAILAHRELLQDFAAATEQHTAMHGLQFRLEHEYVARKTPHLFCVVSGDDASVPLGLDSLVGCVLFFEYRIASWNTGVFATGDSTGFGTVIAYPEIRARVAALASCAALSHGCLVLTCFRGDAEDADEPEIAFPPEQTGLWSAQVREVRDRLPLRSTYDCTLDALGKRTRTHLRYYRKRLQAQTGCVFVPDATAEIAESQLSALNASSLEPLRQRVFDMQFHATAKLPGGYVCGLRAADGRWLSLAGGWRDGRTAMIEWQVNASGFGRLSLGTAFRAFLIEHEIGRGTRQLSFHGGTSHSISHAFQREHAVDLILRRPGKELSLFIRFMSLLAKRKPIANRGNFLIDALRNGPIDWTALSEESTGSVHLARS